MSVQDSQTCLLRNCGMATADGCGCGEQPQSCGVVANHTREEVEDFEAVKQDVVCSDADIM